MYQRINGTNGFSFLVISSFQSSLSLTHSLAFSPSSCTLLFVLVILFRSILIDRLHTLIADFFWPENQLWPAVQQVSWWWVTANFYLNVRAREDGRKREREKERERGSVGERGSTRSSVSGRESISSPRKNATPLATSLYVESTRCLVSPIFFLLSPSFPFFFHLNTSTTVIALSKQSLSPSSR